VALAACTGESITAPEATRTTDIPTIVRQVGQSITLWGGNDGAFGINYWGVAFPGGVVTLSSDYMPGSGLVVTCVGPGTVKIELFEAHVEIINGLATIVWTRKEELMLVCV
jgi:hypothetical protein